MQLVATAVWKCDGLSVQKQTLQTQLFGRPVLVAVAVTLITKQWVIVVFQVYTYLMGAPGQW